MATQIVKIDADNAAVIGTKEVQRIYNSAQLQTMKARLEAQLAEVNSMLEVLK